jgi:signal transduction histidine kinase
MKLITKFILIYLLVTVVVLGIGGFISFFIIKNEIDNELKWEFMERIDRVSYLLEEGRKLHHRRGFDNDQNLTIRQLDYHVEPRTVVSDTLIWHDRLEQNERNVKVTAYRNINNESYYISTHGSMIETDDITEAVVKTLLWILGLQIVGAVGIGLFVSGRLFKPFRSTLRRIRNFKLNEKEYLPAEKTDVKEFSDLNRFVEEMTRKAVKDYKNLKEFSENASHELLTPLAIAKGKLELLNETQLSEEQYRHVESLEKTIKKLSRLSESLALLTKIENHEFGNNQTVNMSTLIKEGLDTFKELIEIKNLEIETDIEDNIQVRMHPVLAELLWTNLLQNAIKHNMQGGNIKVELTRDHLLVSNTGKPLTVPPEQLFERFRKEDQNSSSIGLGLSIVERIVKQNQLEISYTNDENRHEIKISLT